MAKAPAFKLWGTLKLLAFTLTIAYLSRAYIDTGNPVHVWFVRGLYFLSQSYCYGLMGFLYLKAKNNKEPGEVKLRTEDGEERLTISEYDQRECIKEAKKIVMGSLLTLFMHFYWGFIPPMLIQSFTHPYNITETPVSKVTFRGQKPWGELRRPWTELDVLGQQWGKIGETMNQALGSDEPGKRDKKAEKRAKRKTQ